MKLTTIRPTDEAIEQEFTPERQAALLEAIKQERGAEIVPLHRTQRARWVGVAVAAVAGVAVLGLTAQMLSSNPNTTTPVAEPQTNQHTAPEGGSSTEQESTMVAPASLSAVSEAAAGVPAGWQDTYLYVHEYSEQDGDDVSSLSYTNADGWTWRCDNGSFYALYQQDPDNWVANLPTDPAELDAALRNLTGNNSEDERVFKGITEILRSHAASSELRAAAIQTLINLDANPQDPAPAKEGELAEPQLTVEEVTVEDGIEYRITFTDEGSRPGVVQTMVLDPLGQLKESGFSDSETNYISVIVERRWANELTPDLVEILGTEEQHVEVYI